MLGTDRLAEPVLPESPTQVEVGHNLYYFHCMPCHGDRGQGLTDEFREVWVEDHQNCWGRGCHTGKSEMAAFYIPKSVPPVSGVPHALSAFQSAEELFDFLQNTQPPQRPGALSEHEYWALTAFLLNENGRLPADARIGPGVRGDMVLAVTLGLLLVILVVPHVGQRRDKAIPVRRTAGQWTQTREG
jgi:cytochrome c